MSWKRVSKKIGKDPPAVQGKLKVQLQNFLESHALVTLPHKELFLPEMAVRKHHAADSTACSKKTRAKSGV